MKERNKEDLIPLDPDTLAARAPSWALGEPSKTWASISIISPEEFDLKKVFPGYAVYYPFQKGEEMQIAIIRGSNLVEALHLFLTNLKKMR